MTLSSKEVAELKKIMQIAEGLIKKAGQPERGKSSARRATAAAKARRSGKGLIVFREKLKAERKAGVPVAKMAKKFGVSPSYIYQLG